MDKGHRQADKILADITDEMLKVFDKADRKIIKKVRNYLKKFEAEIKEREQMVDDGEITRKEFEQWYVNRVTTGREWEEFRDEIAEDYHEATVDAMAKAGAGLLLVYSFNKKFAGNQITKQIDSFFHKTITPNKHKKPRRPKGILPKSPDPLKNLPWHRKKIESVIRSGMKKGKSIDDIARRLHKVTNMDRVAAYRAARTGVTCAENEARIDAMLDAQDMGIPYDKIWFATLDDRTRVAHRVMHGERVPCDAYFSNDMYEPGDPAGAPEEFYNCFVGETLVATDSEVIRSYKHKYDGELITVKTATGVEFTCTPNHPILTPLGWVSANRLNKGDDIAVTFVGDSKVSRRDPNINHVHARIDAIHQFADVFRRERAGGLRVNFHGDVPTSDVEIVTHKRLLRDNRNASIIKSGNELLLKDADKSFLGDGSFMKHLGSIWQTTFGRICRTGDTFTLFWRSLLHAKKHGLRPVALLDTNGMEPMGNNIAGYSKFFRKRFDGTPAVVFADNIVDINRCSKCTHVYNLQTENGYYFVNTSIAEKNKKCNGIVAVAHNCRCTLLWVPAGMPMDIEEGPDGMGKLEWSAQKPVSKPYPRWRDG